MVAGGCGGWADHATARRRKIACSRSSPLDFQARPAVAVAGPSKGGEWAEAFPVIPVIPVISCTLSIFLLLDFFQVAGK
jgi:hypothetical protein